MNIVITIIISLLIMIGSPNTAAANDKRIEGSVAMSSKNIISAELNAVSTIKASRNVDIEIISSDAGNNIAIEANENIMEYVEINFSGSVMEVTISSEVKTISDIDVTVRIPYNGKFDKFIASSAGEIKSREYLRMSSMMIDASSSSDVSLVAIVEGDCSIEASSSSEVDLIAKIIGSCNVDASSASEVELTISAAELIVECSSSSEVEAEGSVDQLIVSASSASSFEGQDLLAQRGRLKTSSASSIKYWGVGDFKESTSGAGSIKRVK